MNKTAPTQIKIPRVRLSSDPEAVERRHWYGARQQEAITILEKISHIAPWMPIPVIEDNVGEEDCQKNNVDLPTSGSSDLKVRCSKNEGSAGSHLIVRNASSMAVEEVQALPKSEAFTSHLLTLAEESLQHQRALYLSPQGRALTIKKHKGLNNSFQPGKWLYPLNKAAKIALKNFSASSKDVKPEANGNRNRDGRPAVMIQKTNDIILHRRVNSSHVKSSESSKTKKKILVCIPGLSSSHLYYQSWTAALEAEEILRLETGNPQGENECSGIELWSVCLPGRSCRFLEPMGDSVHLMAGCVGDAIVSLGLFHHLLNTPESLPGLLSATNADSVAGNNRGRCSRVGTGKSESVLCLFGHSIGGLIAFETAKYLKHSYGIDVPYLYISCIPSPFAVSEANTDSYSIRRSEASDKELVELIKAFGDPVVEGLGLGGGGEGEAEPSSPEVLSIDEEMHNDDFVTMQAFVPLLRADLSMLENYVMDTYLNADSRETCAASVGNCVLTTVSAKEDTVIIGDDFKAKNALILEKKSTGKGGDGPVSHAVAARRVSQNYLDSIQEWSLHVAERDGKREEGREEDEDSGFQGCEVSHISLPTGGHHGCILLSDNRTAIIADIVHKMK